MAFKALANFKLGDLVRVKCEYHDIHTFFNLDKSIKLGSAPKIGIIVKVIRYKNLDSDDIKKDNNALYYVMLKNEIYEVFYFELGEL